VTSRDAEKAEELGAADQYSRTCHRDKGEKRRARGAGRKAATKWGDKVGNKGRDTGWVLWGMQHVNP
jgi:hypothetical protein